MAQPGWYANPDGTPNTLRYWDGTQWTGQVVGSGGQPHEVPQAPASGPATAKPRTGLWVAIGSGALVVVLVTALFMVGNPLRSLLVPANSTPTASARTMAPQTTAPTDASVPLTCPSPTNAKQLSDGHLSLDVPSGFDLEASTPPWLACDSTAARSISSTWISAIVVGTASLAGGTPEALAQRAWSWNASTNYESSDGAKATIASSAPVTVQGHAAWVTKGQVPITPVDGVTGDDVTVIVIPQGNDSASVVLAVSTIGNAANSKEIDTALASIKLG